MEIKRTVNRTVDLVKNLLFDPNQLLTMGLLCIIAEVFINILIVEKVKYTEIDWKAYMDEVEGFLNGTYDYTQLRGDTGPLVYPAGFVYVFSGLYYLTSTGTNIKLAQYVYAGLYIICYSTVLMIMKKAQAVPPFILLFFTFASYRIHSIFALRLFNDPIAMIFLYFSVLLFLNRKWLSGCVLYSFAVSIKMNIMLFAPGLLFILLSETGIVSSFIYISVCGIIQLLLGLPFLLTNPWGYIKMSFDLGRQFLFEWTVNYRFISEAVFLSRYLHISLLVTHLGLLVALFYNRWSELPRPLSPYSMLIILFGSNFIGVACARSLHYQFYVWYYHTLPALFFSTKLPQVVVMLLLGVIELCWNTYPSTNLSSAALQVCHAVTAISLILPPRTDYEAKHSKKE